MAAFDITMKHTEASLEALAHMQYDLFCRSNRVVRTILSAGMVLLGVMMHEQWWSILAIAYGCYLTTSTYASANRTAHKLTAQIKAAGTDFPGSRFLFDNEGMHIRPLPEKEGEEQLLPYSNFYGLGEDLQYYYIFRDQYGGYMIPKEQLGERAERFRAFVEGRTGQRFRSRMAPVLRLMRRLGAKMG